MSQLKLLLVTKTSSSTSVLHWSLTVDIHLVLHLLDAAALLLDPCSPDESLEHEW